MSRRYWLKLCNKLRSPLLELILLDKFSQVCAFGHSIKRGRIGMQTDIDIAFIAAQYLDLFGKHQIEWPAELRQLDAEHFAMQLALARIVVTRLSLKFFRPVSIAAQTSSTTSGGIIRIYNRGAMRQCRRSCWCSRLVQSLHLPSFALMCLDLDAYESIQPDTRSCRHL